jgi:predicted peptidase
MKSTRFIFFFTAANFAACSCNAADQPELIQVAKRFSEQTITVEENETDVMFRYRLLRPLPSPTRKTFPLVIFFHGSGERGSNNLGQLKYILAPQCRADQKWSSRDMTTDMQAAIKALDHVIATEKVDPQQILVTGLSMGGAATWEMCMRLPERIAAGVPVCGKSDEQFAKLVKDVPLWIFHGDADRVIPVECSRGMVAAVKAAGGSPRYTELPGVGHDSWTAAYHDPEMLDWFFRQRR